MQGGIGHVCSDLESRELVIIEVPQVLELWVLGLEVLGKAQELLGVGLDSAAVELGESNNALEGLLGLDGGVHFLVDSKTHEEGASSDHRRFDL